MADFNQNYGDNKKTNYDFDQFVLLLFIALNGISTGSVIRTGREIAANGADSNSIIALLMYLGCTIYTAQRAYELYKKIHKDDDKNQQR